MFGRIGGGCINRIKWHSDRRRRPAWCASRTMVTRTRTCVGCRRPAVQPWPRNAAATTRRRRGSRVGTRCSAVATPTPAPGAPPSSPRWVSNQQLPLETPPQGNHKGDDSIMHDLIFCRRLLSGADLHHHRGVHLHGPGGRSVSRDRVCSQLKNRPEIQRQQGHRGSAYRNGGPSVEHHRKPEHPVQGELDQTGGRGGTDIPRRPLQSAEEERRGVQREDGDDERKSQRSQMEFQLQFSLQSDPDNDNRWVLPDN